MSFQIQKWKCQSKCRPESIIRPSSSLFDYFPWDYMPSTKIWVAFARRHHHYSNSPVICVCQIHHWLLKTHCKMMLVLIVSTFSSLGKNSQPKSFFFFLILKREKFFLRFLRFNLTFRLFFEIFLKNNFSKIILPLWIF